MKTDNFSDFLSELGEDFDRTWNHFPPVIELRGWWWKKYIRHYRKMREVMQKLVEEEWAQNYERIEHLWRTVEREDRRSVLNDLRR